MRPLIFLLVASLLAVWPRSSPAAWGVRLGSSRLDVPLSPGSDNQPVCYPGDDPDCDPRYKVPSVTVVYSGHFPLVRMLNISVAPFLEAGSLLAPERSGAGLWPYAFAGTDLLYWVLGTRLMVGPHLGAGWSTGGFKMLGGMAFSWCVSCSAGSDAGWFRRHVDRIELRGDGTFDPSRKDGDFNQAFTGSVERFEVGVVFRTGSK